jgi:hypothetical protein
LNNIDATGEVLSPLGREDKQGLSLVERGPRNLPPPPEQQHNTGEPYPGIGLQLNPYSTRGVVAIRRDDAEVIGKMLRVWAYLESARAAEIAAQPERALVTTRKRRHANEEHIETGRASQWTVPPHRNWITLARELGEWLCAKTSESTDVYISMNLDALEQAVRRDQPPADEESASAPPAATAPTQETKVLTIQTRTWHSQKETANGGLVTMAHGQWCKEDGANTVVGLYTVESEIIADLARLGVVSSGDADVVMLTTSDPAVIDVLVRHRVARGQLP